MTYRRPLWQEVNPQSSPFASRATSRNAQTTALCEGVSHNERLTPWSLRDNPVALLISVIGALAILIALGWLTVRIGSIWVRAYTHRQIQTDD
ncbi:MAG TPA: hypothetical protein VKT77_07725 [Chthonomonadaceae bacterium]|nr:hypothetical protein [Chthonomonadaceae bacterium]